MYSKYEKLYTKLTFFHVQEIVARSVIASSSLNFSLQASPHMYVVFYV